MTERVARWQAAWEGRDPNAVAALYVEDATHASGRVAVIWPELGTTVLHGVAQIRDYARRALARFTSLRFEVLTVTEGPIRSAVEYRRHSNLDGDHPALVLELIEWRGDLIQAVRVFHYGGH